MSYDPRINVSKDLKRLSLEPEMSGPKADEDDGSCPIPTAMTAWLDLKDEIFSREHIAIAVQLLISGIRSRNHSSVQVQLHFSEVVALREKGYRLVLNKEVELLSPSSTPGLRLYTLSFNETKIHTADDEITDVPHSGSIVSAVQDRLLRESPYVRAAMGALMKSSLDPEKAGAPIIVVLSPFEINCLLDKGYTVTPSQPGDVAPYEAETGTPLLELSKIPRRMVRLALGSYRSW